MDFWAQVHRQQSSVLRTTPWFLLGLRIAHPCAADLVAPESSANLCTRQAKRFIASSTG